MWNIRFFIFAGDVEALLEALRFFYRPCSVVTWQKKKKTSLNLSPDGGLESPPPVFFQIARKRRHCAPPFLAHLIIHIFRICCKNFRPMSRKVRSPGHVKWPHFIKVWMLVKATPTERLHSNFKRWISIPVSMKHISRNFDFGYLRSGQFRDLSIINKSTGEKMKDASFGRKPFKTLWNTGLQLDLTPWVGTLWQVTPRHVAKVISGHGRSTAVFRQ